MPSDYQPIENGTAILIVLSALGFLGFMNHLSSQKEIARNMQEGFTAPSKIEVLAKDVDNNGKFETVLEAEDKSYLLRKVNGEYTLAPYSVDSSKIKYQE